MHAYSPGKVMLSLNLIPTPALYAMLCKRDSFTRYIDSDAAQAVGARLKLCSIARLGESDDCRGCKVNLKSTDRPNMQQASTETFK
jgi:hypothetical protein